MEQKTYIIRQIAYHYNDEYLYEASEGSIAAEHNDYETAYKGYRDKEITALRNAELYDIEPFSTCSANDGDVREKLHQYFLDQFNVPLLKDQEGGYKDIDRDFHIPAIATDEQVWEIKLISGIRFYTLSAFEGKPVFYVINIYGNAVRNVGESPYFFNSYEAAVSELPSYKNHFTLKGKPEELSDMPTIFLQLVNANSEIFQYNAEMTQLKITMSDKGQDHGKKFMELSETLKVKPITITPLSIDDAIMIDHDDYEMM